MTQNTAIQELTAQEIEALSFEQALEQLEAIIHNIETGKETLETSITAYNNGMLLKNHCEKKLKEAQLKVDKIVANSNGNHQIEDFVGES